MTTKVLYVNVHVNNLIIWNICRNEHVFDIESIQFSKYHFRKRTIKNKFKVVRKGSKKYTDLEAATWFQLLVSLLIFIFLFRERKLLDVDLCRQADNVEFAETPLQSFIVIFFYGIQSKVFQIYSNYHQLVENPLFTLYLFSLYANFYFRFYSMAAYSWIILFI